MSLSVSEILTHIENSGRQRASKNSEIWNESGVTPEDHFVIDEMIVWNPWFSDCSRFEVDPYKQYGRPFVEWLLRPFYPNESELEELFAWLQNQKKLRDEEEKYGIG